MNLGFIGLGIMGAPMAANLIKAGHEVTGYNRSSAKVERLAEAGGDARLAEQHGLHVGRVGQHQEHDVGAFGHAAGGGAHRGAARRQRRRHLAAGVHEQQVARGQQVAGHRRAHHAQADEAESESGFRHCSCCIQWMPSRVVVRGRYSQPMKPFQPSASRCRNRKG